MCAIVDTNLASRFFGEPVDQELKPLWEWIASGHGVLVAGGKLLDELSKIGEASRVLRNWERVELARFIQAEDVRAETERIEGHCVSDDAHVIAVARLSGARLLCSADRTLHADFGNRDLINNPRGRVYQNRGHTHLLTHEGRCPLAAPAADRRRAPRR